MIAACSKLGFGGAPIGGLFEPVSADQAQKTLEAAWSCGVRYFDTAPLYGNGLSETRIGEFLANKPRDSFVVSTKVGRTLVPSAEGPRAEGSLAAFYDALPYDAVFDFSADGIRRSLEASLERLNVSFVDIAFLHDPDDHLETAMQLAYPALRALRDECVLREIGVGCNSVATAERFVRECDLDTLMLAGRYSLLDQSAAETLFPLCESRGVRVVAAGVFNSGILAQARPVAGARYDYAPASEEVVERARRIAVVCEQHGVELRAAALAFPLRSNAVSKVVVGMRSPEEARANAESFVRAIPSALWTDLERMKLVAS